MSASRSRRQFTKEFKLQVLHEVMAGKPLAQAAREHQVHPNCIHSWRAQQLMYGEKAFAGNGNAYTQEAKIAELERMVGQQAMEISLLKKVLAKQEEARRQIPAPPQRGTNATGGSKR